MYYADSMAFLGLQGQPPDRHAQLDLALVTSAPPFLTSYSKTLAAHGLFMEQALATTETYAVTSRESLNRPQGTGLVFGLQHAPQDLRKDDVRELYREGIRSMALAYNGPTEYGHGFQSMGGLTKRGQKLIEWMTEYGIILDLSHTNDETALAALQFVVTSLGATDVMASHSGCRAVYDHPRNLSDEAIRQIHGLGGYVGIPAITFFIGAQGEDYFEAFAEHVKHAIEVCGDTHHVGIGSDCNHLDMSMEAARFHYEKMTQMLKTEGKFGEYFPDRPPELIQHGSHMFEVFQHMLARKVPDAVLGENFKNFLKHALR